MRFLQISAGCAHGIEAWDLRSTTEVTLDTFLPRLTSEEREVKVERWRKALERSKGWVESPSKSDEVKKRFGTMSEETFRRYSSIPCAIFVVTSLLLLKIAAFNEDFGNSALDGDVTNSDII